MENPEGVVRRWYTELDLADKEREDFLEQAKVVIKRYLDEGETSSVRYNIFWSNVQTLQPALYSRTPKPVATRRFLDKDAVGRTSAQLIERALEFSLDAYDFDTVIKSGRDDYLIVGFGQARVMHVVHEDEEGEPAYEEARCEYVHYTDFNHSPARKWEEVRWVSFRHFMTRDDLVSNFGDKGEKCALNWQPDKLTKEQGGTAENDYLKRAIVYEIWNKDDGKVYWVSHGLNSEPLLVEDDPLGLEGFFPCPMPLLATHTNDSLIPVSDYKIYQDQADELDEISARIACLEKAIRVVSAHDASCSELAQLFTAADNTSVPIENWPAFSSDGAIEGKMFFLPIEQMAKVLQILYQAREAAKQALYELTGMSDIIRGASNPMETATAQQIKGQFATLRLADRQAEIQRFARDLIALKAEIIAEKFSTDTLSLMTGTEFLAAVDSSVPVTFEAAVEVLRSDFLRKYRIDIETDSTIAIDEQLEKQAATEMLTSMGQFVQQTVPMLGQIPSLAPAFVEMLMHMARRFSAGRAVEESLEQGMEFIKFQAQAQVQQIAQSIQNPPQPQPDPQMMKAQADMQLKQMEVQSNAALKQQEFQFNVQMEQLKAQLQAQGKQQEAVIDVEEMQKKFALEREKLNGELTLKAEKMMGDMRLKAAELAQKYKLDTLDDLGVEGVGPSAPKVTEAEIYTDPVTGTKRLRAVTSRGAAA